MTLGGERVIDTSSPAGALLQKMATDLSDRRAHLTNLEDYYRGVNGIPVHAGRHVRESYQRLMQISRLNLARVIVEATRELMEPIGFRTGAAGDEGGDAEAWRIWQANSLDADHMLVDRATLTMGRSAMMVGPVDPEIGAPLITAEDPREVIVRHDPQRRRKATAALKLYVDKDAGFDRAVFFPQPGWMVKASRKRASGDTGSWVEDVSMSGWTLDGSPEKLPVPQVPVVEFLNLAGINGTPEGEFEAHLAALDRVTFTVLNRLEAMTMQAFRQRGIKGLPNVDPISGEEIDYSGNFMNGPGELWQLPQTAEIWESGIIDLGPILQAEKQDVVSICGATQTPIQYLFPDDNGGSAEGAQLKREARAFKVADRNRQQAESYEQVMALAFAYAGDAQRASRGDMEVIWAPTVRYSLEQKADAVAKYHAAGISLETIARDVLQKSPQEIARMRGELAAQSLLVGDVDQADTGATL